MGMRSVRSKMLLALCLSFPPALVAQVSGGTVSGTVTNSSAAPLPNVRVAVTDVQTGAARTVTTDPRGFYAIPNLAPDTYELAASVRGFETEVRTGLAVTVGAQLVLNVTMKPGNPEKVVREAAVLSSQASSTVSGNISSSTVRETPLNGRDWTQLATLQAGVTGVQTGTSSGGGNTTRGFGAAMSISGARPDQNSYRLDGISINDYSNGAPGSVLGDNLGVDAVEQFSVLGSNYPAQYGRTSGGVINAVTRSGTNAFHGSVYEFLRNSSLDARNFFDSKIPPFRRNQFGGSIGGPIRKGGTFFFADYEGLRQSLGVTTVDTVPSPAARAGNLCSIPSGGNPPCRPATVPVDPTVARYMAAFYPLPNASLLGNGDTGIFTFAGQQVTSENYFTTRMDHKFSNKDSVSGTYMRDYSETVQPDPFNSLLSNTVSHRQVATFHEQHIFSPTFLNVARLGFNRAVGIVGGITKVLNPALTDPTYGFVAGQFAGDIQTVPGLTNKPPGVNTEMPGVITSSESAFWNSFQGGDDAFYTRGVHALQFGVGVERMQDNLRQVASPNGTYRFASLANFLTNVPRTFQGLTSSLSTFGMRQTIFGTYLQDDIQARRNLTLNLGLRYEMSTVPSEAHNRLSSLLSPSGAQPHLGVPYFSNPTLRNFEPRLGFAWNPRSKTVLRGGAGLFDVLPLPYGFTLLVPGVYPYTQEVFANVLPPGSFPGGAFALVDQDPALYARANYIEQHPKRNYVVQWNLNLAQELSPGLVATLGYVGSRGVHQPFRMDDLNFVLPTLTPAGYLFPLPGTGQRLNPNYGRVDAMLWQANSFYDALEADIAKKVSHGIELHAAYTWGKSIDTLSATVAADAFPNGLFGQLFFDQRTSRGLSDFDVSQNFVLSYTWELPSPRSHSRLVNGGLGGWQIGGVYKASTGQPFTPLFGGDPLGMKLEETSEPPDRLAGCTPVNGNFKSGAQGLPIYLNTNCFTVPTAPAALLGACQPFPHTTTPNSCANLFGNAGRNIVIGPGISNLDFSVFKNNRIRRISETFNVQFRAEFFNILNRTNFASPTDNLVIFNPDGSRVPSGGLLTVTQTTSRQIQFAVKIVW